MLFKNLGYQMTLIKENDIDWLLKVNFFIMVS